MSFQAMAWAVDQKLPTREKFVLLMLANRTNHDTGRCDPSHKRVAEDCGMSVSSIKRAIVSLEEQGYLVTENRSANNVKLPNQYRLCTERGVGSHSTYPGQAEPTPGQAEPTVRSHRPEGVGSHRPIKQESSKPGNKPGIKPEEPCGDLLGQAELQGQVVPFAPAKKSADDERLVAFRATWRAYADAYFTKYGTEPVTNAKVNRQVNDLMNRVGREAAPYVAAHYVSINKAYYVGKCHPFSVLVADCEAIHTLWITNRSMTDTRARQIDQSQSNLNTVDEALAILRQQGRTA